ncbi:MAG: hypothetical protein B6D82_18835 [gamma proteobacterium symbiont of Ctena orbiculata]|nr:MAG: hypothetical protein DBP00_08070 [gamma proteobacterium symbiont of Ctena orbiculata]PVV06058.1 MAG: hypothetical protein B6D82_18835 [gamma proteobacterium symbiont of Ctena orbiculata]
MLWGLTIFYSDKMPLEELGYQSEKRNQTFPYFVFLLTRFRLPVTYNTIGARLDMLACRLIFGTDQVSYHLSSDIRIIIRGSNHQYFLSKVDSLFPSSSCSVEYALTSANIMTSRITITSNRISVCIYFIGLTVTADCMLTSPLYLHILGWTSQSNSLP